MSTAYTGIPPESQSASVFLPAATFSTSSATFIAIHHQRGRWLSTVIHPSNNNPFSSLFQSHDLPRPPPHLFLFSIITSCGCLTFSTHSHSTQSAQTHTRFFPFNSLPLSDSTSLLCSPPTCISVCLPLCLYIFLKQITEDIMFPPFGPDTCCLTLPILTHLVGRTICI